MDQLGHNAPASDNALSTPDIRCHQCSKLLAKHLPEPPGLEIKCVRCGTLNPVRHTTNLSLVITDAGGNILHQQELTQTNTTPLYNTDGTLLGHLTIKTTS